ncbi:uncharacterized protein BJ212DRAFT_1411768 [Suillus subaureus]|uniref:Uncharacterized protein n=1 Tax=Suillus subaureus TaxID=48587 RepID=A0A9P7DJ40_9AGAM|nr:uncharacterized protein BJ212DRAFT_1411768 [Suillus subaureus]KAG1794966.1 hypothetical protein BJ212DRAFT_1411768 [Suillus subaureus]
MQATARSARHEGQLHLSQNQTPGMLTERWLRSLLLMLIDALVFPTLLGAGMVITRWKKELLSED